MGRIKKKNRLIPIIINSCLNERKFSCTHGLQLRDFLFVEDFINLILKIIKKKKIKKWNLQCWFWQIYHNKKNYYFNS